jgi:hypothetical protein
MYTLKSQIERCNLGDGWTDIDKAAYALARYTEATWRADSSDFKNDIEIGFIVKKKEYGYDVEISINIDYSDIADEITALLTDEATIWDRFCNDVYAIGVSRTVRYNR